MSIRGYKKTGVSYRLDLQEFGELEEAVAVAAFDEDVEAFGAVGGDGGFYFFDIVELAEGTGDVAEVVAYEPYLVVAGSFEIAYQLAVLLVAFLTQLAHLPEDDHLAGSLDEGEIVERSLHRGGVGVVGVDDEVVLLSDGHLRTVVRGCVFLKGGTYLLAVHAKVDAYGYGGQEVVDVIRSDETGLHLVPLCAAAFLLKHHQRLAPAELQEGIALDDLA